MRKALVNLFVSPLSRYIKLTKGDLAKIDVLGGFFLLQDPSCCEHLRNPSNCNQAINICCFFYPFIHFLIQGWRGAGLYPSC